MPQLHPAEGLLPGHPDKIADALADAIVQEASRLQRRARADLAVLVGPSGIRVNGRLDGCRAEQLDLAALVNAVDSSAGYSGEWQRPIEKQTVTWEVVGDILNAE
jgi:S-adenosylmethionine synthetase